MGYVAAKGGTEAVLHAEQLLEYFRLKGESEPITVRQIQEQMRLAVDRAMGEGSLYAPELAALALKQSEGDALEASFLLRAYRSTVPRLAYSLPAEGVRMRAIRRISATFKDIPGGQLLGPTRDYQLKLLNTLLANESDQSMHDFLDRFEESIDEKASDGQAGIFPKVTENMRAQGILAEPPPVEQAEALAEPYDVTRKALSFPAPRGARLQLLAQGDVGSLQMFAYSSVRGYGDVHPTLGELRLGYIPVEVAHPLTNEPVEIGEILATECEMVSRVYAEGEQKGEEPSLPKRTVYMDRVGLPLTKSLCCCTSTASSPAALLRTISCRTTSRSSPTSVSWNAHATIGRPGLRKAQRQSRALQIANCRKK